MNKPAPAAIVANLARHLEAFLIDHRFCFSRQTHERRFRDVFDLIVETDEAGLTEQRITVYIQKQLLVFEAVLPVTCTDEDAVAALVNYLNLHNAIGTFQLDLEDMELNWTSYLVAGNGAWPGDDIVLSRLETAREMVGVLYRALCSVSRTPTENDQ